MVLSLFLAFLLFFGCTHERDNPYDPHGTKYDPSLYLSSSSSLSVLVPCMHTAGCAEISAEACFASGGQLVAFCSVSSSSSLQAEVSSGSDIYNSSSSFSGGAGSSSSLPEVMVLCMLSDGTCPLTLISQENCGIFGGTPVQSCVGSSSSAPLSSSSIAPSSSSAPTFACTMTATTGTVGVAISPAPVATCNGSTVTDGLAWTPANLTSRTAGSVPVSVVADSGVCSGMAAWCGSVTVSAPTLACTGLATTGAVGVAMPAPTVTCNGTAVTTGLEWTPENLTPTVAGSVPVSVVAGSGVCNGIATQCGSVTVSITYGSLHYEGQSYKTIKIGTQTWMAENLNYVVEGSKCYDNDPANCNTYGSLYNWATAMALPSSCNSTSCSSQINNPYRGICPSGWHIPSDAEWTTLTSYVGSSTAGTKLKATSGWNNKYDGSSGNGTDEFGFSALPGGYGNSSGLFGNVGNSGNWWSATENDATYAYGRDMLYIFDDVGSNYNSNKSVLCSVRCIQD